MLLNNDKGIIVLGGYVDDIYRFIYFWEKVYI